MSDPRSRRNPLILLAVVFLLLAPVAGCGVFERGPSAEDITESYLQAVAAGDDAGAAQQTTNPDAARRALESTRRSLSPEAVRTTVKDVSAEGGDGPVRARFDIAWDFGNNQVWRYEGSVRLREQEQEPGGWKVQWEPSAIHPELQQGQSLRLDRLKADPQPLRGRNGAELMRPQTVVSVMLDPGAAGDVSAVAGELGSALGQVDPRITRDSILSGVSETRDGQAYLVAQLRAEDYDRVRGRISELPGVSFPAQSKLLADDRDFGTQVLSGIAQHIDERLEQNAGWSVSIVDAQGRWVKPLQEQQPEPAAPVTTTLSDDVQRAAEQAVDPVPQAAMVVAMQPSSGDVLAVAQNQPADAQGTPALMGQYPPGSTFKIVTASAALSSGRVTADAPVDCPSSKVFDGRTVPNDKDFELGTVPLQQAFARSCNTTFAQLGVDMPPNALPDAARQLGLGVDFVMPGATTITGKVPPPETTTAKAANAFGQGTVLASPFGMALATSTVANGRMPLPTLIEGTETQANAQPEPPPQRTLEQLRPMMREVVRSGTATELQGSGEVAGKTGTAQYGDGERSHGWFAGYRGDLAFAVLITDAGESGPAVDLAKDFLDNTP